MTIARVYDNHGACPLRPESILTRIISSFVKHKVIFLLLALVLTALSSAAAYNIRILTSRRALLPANVDVTKRLNDFLNKFGSANDLIVVIQGAPRPQMEEFTTELARRLEKNKNIRSVNERVDILFFLKHAYLMIPPDTLEQFSKVVDSLIGVRPPDKLNDWADAWKRTADWLENPPDLGSLDIDIKSAKEGMNLVQFVLDQWLRWLDAPKAPNSISWNTLLASHGAQSMSSGYYSSRDGKLLFMFVRPKDSSEEFEHLKPFIDGVKINAKELQIEWRKQGKTPPQVGLTGLPAASFEEFVAVRHDIKLTITTAIGLIILLILIWLRSVRWAIVVFVPMALGVVWNIGAAYLILGHLTIITSGFTAILFGLGIDYGIFMSTRIIEERTHEQDLLAAIVNGTVASARALLVAGGATVLIFVSLSFVEFDGFSELGIVAASGVLLVLVSTFVLQPIAFFLLPPKVKSPKRFAAEKSFLVSEKVSKGKVKLLQSANVLLVLVAVSGAVLGAIAAFHIPFDYDVMSLLPKDSEAAKLQRLMLKKSDYQGEVVIFTANSIPEARQMAKRAAKLPAIARVQTITDIFPKDAAQRARTARDIGKKVDESVYASRIRSLGDIKLEKEYDPKILHTLEKLQEVIEDGQEQAFSAGHAELVKQMEKILDQIEKINDRWNENPDKSRQRTRLYVGKLAQAGKSALDVLKAWKQASILNPRDLPSNLYDRFFSKDGQVAFYAFPAGNIYDTKVLDELIKQVYSVSKNVTGFPTTHHVFSRMVVSSFRHGSVAAAIIALLWIALVFRRFKGILIASLPLLVGGGWMMGIMYVAGMKFNFANIIGLPLVMGLAVDYGVWFAHRKMEMTDMGGWQIASIAGKAILLAAGTTLAGLGAITMASYRGVASMGVAITIGLLCCVASAMLVSPAIAQLIYRNQKEKDEGH